MAPPGSTGTTGVSVMTEWRIAFRALGVHSPQWRPLYQRYLKSPEWQAKRAECLELAGGLCEDCDEPATHVHHLTYRRVGAERMRDLRALCPACHARRHNHMLGPEATFADRVRAEGTRL